MAPEEYERMDAVESRMWWYRALHARLLDALSEHHAPESGLESGAFGGPVLDAGCGTGGFLACLASSQGAFGLELHGPAAATAAGKSGRSVACGSINQIPFAANTFSAVVVADVLCHAAVDPVSALAEIRRVLRPKGRLIVNMPAYRALMSAHDAHVHNARRMNAGETRTMLENAGFHVRRIHYWNGLLLPLLILQRKIFARASDRSGTTAFAPWLDRLLHGMTELERRLGFSLPAGSSVLAIAERP
jgi:SAM-dependent methyltransferase